ncbi:MAG: hypothetical protein P8X42_19265 [Calditrichaceae bacterium]
MDNLKCNSKFISGLTGMRHLLSGIVMGSQAHCVMYDVVQVSNGLRTARPPLLRTWV